MKPIKEIMTCRYIPCTNEIPYCGKGRKPSFCYLHTRTGMIARIRKALFEQKKKLISTNCSDCGRQIDNGNYSGQKLTKQCKACRYKRNKQARMNNYHKNKRAIK